MGKARATAEKAKANGEKANSDPRAAERGSRPKGPKGTKVEKGTKGNERDTKGRAGTVDKLAANRPSATTTRPCKERKHKETEEISGQSNWQAP